MDLNQDIGALAAELLGKMKRSKAKPDGGAGISKGLLAALALVLPGLAAIALPTYQFSINSGLPSDYQSNLAAREQKSSEYDIMNAQLSERLLQINSSGGLFEEQREIEQFFSFIADQVVSHRLDTKSFAQTEVLSPDLGEGETLEQDYYVVNPGAKLELAGEYDRVMAFLQAVRDLDKEVLISSLVFGHPERTPNDVDAIIAPELNLSLSLQVFRLVSAVQ
jgi:hypothetical protein